MFRNENDVVSGGGEVAGLRPRRRRPSRSTLRLRALPIATNPKAIEVALLLLNAWACVAGSFIIVQVQQRVGTLTRQVAVNASVPIPAAVQLHTHELSALLPLGLVPVHNSTTR